MKVEFIFLELLLTSLLLGGIIAHKKSVGERLILFLTVPVSFLLSFVITKLGVFDFLGKIIADAILSIPEVAKYLSTLSSATTGISAILSAFIRPFITTLLFLLLLIVSKVVTSISLKKKKAEGKGIFAKGEKLFDKKNLLAILIGAIGGAMIFSFSLLPVTFITNLVEPAVIEAQSPEFEGTWAHENAKVISREYLPASKNTVFGTLQTYTGMKAILNATAESLSEVSLKSSHGTKIKFNATELFQMLVSDAVDAMIFAENLNSPGVHTISQAKSVANIIDRLADSNLVLAVASELLEDYTPADDASPVLKNLVENAKKHYSPDDVHELSRDLSALAGVVRAVADGGEGHELSSSNVLALACASLSEEATAVSAMKELSKLSIYPETLASLTRFGVTLLCENMQIAENREDAYAKLLSHTREALNNRSVGDINFDKVEDFIVYLSNNGISPATYTIKNKDSLTSRDIEFMNYERYMTRKEEFESTFNAYMLDDDDLYTYFVTKSGTVFALADGKWKRVDTSKLNRTGLLSDYLIKKSVEAFDKDMTHTFDEEDMTALLKAFSPTGNKTLSQNAKEASEILLDEKKYQPEGAVYSASVLSAIIEKDAFTEKDNISAGKAISSAASLAVLFFENDESDTISLILSNFSKVGRLLDALCEYEMTAKVPSALLRVVVEHKDFGQYFVSDSIIGIAEKAEKGEASYENLFASVQAIYNIVNKIIL